ncbi:MAG: universal stress protein [Candidatus Aminicenantes bacterium]|nr:universal stress protein [Candidatus Aminicenantes bacterium]
MAKLLKKVLWATDFSDEGQEAFLYADIFARIFGAELVACHVVPGFTPDHYQSAIVVIDELNKRMAHMKKMARDRFESFQKKKGVKFEYLIRDGNASKEIIAAAEKEKADLIVIGRKGLSAIERLFIGSVANHVLRNSPVPVLMTKKKRGKPKFKKILVPTDFSEQEDEERNYAWKLAKAFDANITLLHVLELHDYDFAPRVLEEMLDAVLNKMKQRKKKEKEDIKVAEDVYRAINAAVGIVDYADMHKFDLIVISTCTQSKLERFFLGSTTEKVISYSHIPVFAIPPAQC